MPQWFRTSWWSGIIVCDAEKCLIIDTYGISVVFLCTQYSEFWVLWNIFQWNNEIWFNSTSLCQIPLWEHIFYELYRNKLCDRAENIWFIDIPSPTHGGLVISWPGPITHWSLSRDCTIRGSDNSLSPATKPPESVITYRSIVHQKYILMNLPTELKHFYTRRKHIWIIICFLHYLQDPMS